MVATGVGAAAGALMIAAGVVGVVNMAVQQAAEDGRISPEDMKIAGPILMAVEILLAVASAVVTFGAGAVKGLAKLGVKMGFKMAGKGASEAGLKLIQNSAKVYLKAADVSSKLAGSTASKVAKFGTQTADLIVDVSNGVTKSVDSDRGVPADHGDDLPDAQCQGRHDEQPGPQTRCYLRSNDHD